MDSGAELVWYVAYGSNMSSERLRNYLSGGRPRGSLRTYAGARDPAEPRRTRPIGLPGTLAFAGHSSVWTGGIAFYDARGTGTVAARAYLMTSGQANDLVAQEIRRPPGAELDLLAERPSSLRPLGGHVYDIALRLEDIDGRPTMTITSSRSREPTAPSASYLHWICRGLHETYGWSPRQMAEYLAPFPGIAGAWSLEELARLAARTDPDVPAASRVPPVAP